MKKKMKLWLWLLISPAALLTIVIIWALTTDLGFLKPKFETLISDQIGRELTISGDLNLMLGRKIVVKAQGLRITNASWAQGVNMLELESFRLQLDLWSLISGPIVIDQIEMDQATVNLELRAGGEANWQLVDKPNKETSASNQHEGLLNILLNELVVNQVAINYRSPARIEPLSVTIESIHQRLLADNFLEGELLAKVGDRSLVINSRIGTWDNLRAIKDANFNIVAKLDSVTIELSGQIDNLQAPLQPTLDLVIKGPDIDALTLMFGLGDAYEGPLDLTASMAINARGASTFKILGNLGVLTIAANGNYVDLQTLSPLDFSLKAHSPSTEPYLSYLGLRGFQDEAFNVDIKGAIKASVFTLEQSQAVVGTSQIQFSGLMPNFPDFNGLKLNLDLNVSDLEPYQQILKFPTQGIAPLKLIATVDVLPNGSEMIQAELSTALGEAYISGELDLQNSWPLGQLKLKANGAKISNIGMLLGLSTMPEKPFTLNGLFEFNKQGVKIINPVELEADGIKFQVKGLVTKRLNFENSELGFSLVGDKLSDLTGIFDLQDNRPRLPYSISGSLLVQKNAYRIKTVEADVGTTHLSLTGSLSKKNNLDGSLFSLNAKGQHIEEILNIIRKNEKPISIGPFEVEANAVIKNNLFVTEKFIVNHDQNQIDASAELAWPLAFDKGKLRVKAKGKNIQAVTAGFQDFVPDALPYTVDANVSWQNNFWTFNPLKVQLGKATIKIEGEAVEKNNGWKTTQHLSVQIPDLSKLGLYYKRRFLPHAITLDGHIVGNEQKINIKSLSLNVGDKKMNLDAAITLKPQLNVQVQADKLAIVPMFVSDFKPAVAKKNESITNATLIPDIEISSELLPSVDGQFTMHVDELTWNKIILKEFKLNTVNKAGVLTLKNLEFLGKQGWFKANAVLNTAIKGGSSTITIKARDFQLDVFETSSDKPIVANLDVDLQSVGMSTKAMAANSQGGILLKTVGGQRLNTKIFSLWFGGIVGEILQTFNPFYKTQPYSNFDCIVLPMSVKQGILKTVPLVVIQTDRVGYFLNSEVDLKTERIKTTIKSLPRHRLGLSAGEILNPYIQVGGTLAKPSIVVDPVGTSIAGGAAVATGGMSILFTAAWNRVFKSKDPCGDSLKEATALLKITEVSASD